ncbi:MAG TPA: sugar ABC transporter permease, partial [Thalassospira lucentensis]|nr:sugar ABC transporter permease [Thalassospira lucentensis]
MARSTQPSFGTGKLMRAALYAVLILFAVYY